MRKRASKTECLNESGRGKIDDRMKSAEKRVTVKKYGGDDKYSWAVFIDGKPWVTGLSRSEVPYYKKNALALGESMNKALGTFNARDKTILEDYLRQLRKLGKDIITFTPEANVPRWQKYQDRVKNTFYSLENELVSIIINLRVR
jgi:hypothetical protein